MIISHYYKQWLWLDCLTALLLLMRPSAALAHVDLKAPNGGETLIGGTSFSIQWMPAIAMHDTLNYDLWYSATTTSGPWTAIATNVPAGDLSVGSLHSYAWLVPNTSAPNAWVRILQDNASQDYEDVSDTRFTIIPQLLGDFNNDRKVDAADYIVWRNRTTTFTYATWRTNFGRSSPATSASSVAGSVSVPEPGCGALFLLFAIEILLDPQCKRRPG